MSIGKITRSPGGEPVLKLDATVADRLKRLDASRSDDFAGLAKDAGFNPARDFIGANLAGLPFGAAKSDLRGFDLSEADLRGTRIRQALLDKSTLVHGAKLDEADRRALLASGFDIAKRRKFPPPDFSSFREAPFAPEMVVLPAGSFKMGSDLADTRLKEGDPNYAWRDQVVPRKGKRDMAIARRFAIGKYPVTFEEFEAFCVAAKRAPPEDQGWGKGLRPVINVSWDEAMEYVRWLNRSLGKDVYRLPSEAEWEYACRAGTNTRRWWGDEWVAKRANGARSFQKGRTSPVDHYPGNPWGLHDMIGNVWEWCADRYNEKLGELPVGGLPFDPQDKIKDNFPYRSLRGGAWDIYPRSLRAASRSRDLPGDRDDVTGFRLARTLNP